MDEPLGALDRALREEMQYELKSLQRDLGVTVVYVTHDQGEAMAMADQIRRDLHGPDPTSGQACRPIRATCQPLRCVLRRRLQFRPRNRGGSGCRRVGSPWTPPGPEPLAPPDIELAIRPEAIRFSGEVVGDTVSFSAEVRDWTFLGDHSRIQLQLDDGQKVVATRPRNSGSAFAVGARVTVGAEVSGIYPRGGITIVDRPRPPGNNSRSSVSKESYRTMSMDITVHRRTFAAIGMCAAVLASSAPAAFAQDNPEASPELQGQVVIASYGGSFADAQREAYFTPFAEATGVEVIEDTGSSYAKVKTMVDTDTVSWDVVSADGNSFANEVKDGLLEPLDFSIIDVEGIEPGVVSDYGIGYILYSQNMAWSLDAYPDGAPQTPADFLDVEKFPGRRTMPVDPSQTLEFALLADGVPAEELYPLDVDRALAALDRIKDVTVFRDASDQVALVSQGEVSMAFMPNGRIANAITGGANWDYGWDGSVIVTENWAVPKGAPDITNAMQFINFAIQPEPQAALAEIIPYGPTNSEAIPLLDDELAASLPVIPRTSHRVCSSMTPGGRTTSTPSARSGTRGFFSKTLLHGTRRLHGGSHSHCGQQAVVAAARPRPTRSGLRLALAGGAPSVRVVSGH